MASLKDRTLLDQTVISILMQSSVPEKIVTFATAKVNV